MDLYNFEQKIESRIVKRGLNYFEDGHIHEIEQVDKGEFSALVCGTDDYNVFVSINQKLEILESSCDCPYDWGMYCKHEVAVFYHLKKGGVHSTKMEDSSIHVIKSSLEHLKKKEIIDLILRMAKRNNIFRENLAEELL